MFFPTSEGFYDFRKKQYIYQYKDQVGNVRLSYWVHPDEQVLKILDKNDYYPFGMNTIQESEYSVTTSPLNYKFQEQELQETGFYSFKWRNYMPDVGRFFGVDPLSEKYSYQSHYNFSENRMLDGRELEGLERVDNNGDFMDYREASDFARATGGWVELRDNEIPEVWHDIDEVIVKGQAKSGNSDIDIEQDESDISDIDSYSELTPYQGPEPGGGGLVMMDSVWDVIGIVLANSKPENQYAAMALGALAIVASKGKATDDVLKAESNLWKVGIYSDLKGTQAGLHAHHVGQSAVMNKMIEGYSHNSAPSILVPELGHVFKGPFGRVSTNTRGLTTPRQVLSRDIMELRRVYGPQGIPNSSLQELIQMNKTMYPGAFSK